jgi:hypothetical protein
VLEDLPLEQASLMTAAATAVLCAVLGMWIPHRGFRIWFPVIMSGCAVGAAVVGSMYDYAAHSMLVVWSFTLIGLTAGLVPLRGWLVEHTQGPGRGVPRDPHDVPRWRLAFCVILSSLMALAGAVLTTPK